jgi:hypothetical protein
MSATNDSIASVRRFGQNSSSALLAGISLFMIVGCAKNQPLGPTSAPTPQENWSTQSVAVPAQGAEQRPVRQGNPPLNYIVESASLVRIVDVTNNAELLSIPVQGRTIISLTVNGGLKIGGATMRYPTLPADHVFAIYLGNATEDQNYIRTGTVRPGMPLTSPPPVPPGNTPTQINPGGAP